MPALNGHAQAKPTRFPKAFLDELRSRTPMAPLVGRRVKLTRSGNHHKGCCPFHDDKNPSLAVYSDHFHCYACQARGDAIEFVTRTEGVAFQEAVTRLAGDAGIPMPDTYTARARSPLPPPGEAAPIGRHEFRAMVPPPADALPPTAAELRCDKLHTYRGAEGEVLLYIRRTEARGKKSKRFLPLTYGTKNSRTGWHPNAPGCRRPLYGLDKLAARPDAPVMICEGEKAAEAAQWLFPDMVCVTWPGGSSAVRWADWTPLKDRRTGRFMWPDNDPPGHDAAAEVAALVPGVRLLRVGDLPSGADAADVQPDDPAAWLRDRLPPEPALETPLPLLWLDDIMPVLDAKDFVQGVLTEGGAAVVYGDSNAGKTFWVTDLALHVATGKAWNGRRVDQGGVVYCAMEGGNGFRNRVAAWRQAHVAPPQATQDATPFAAVPASLNLLDPEGDTSRLIGTVQAAAERMGRAVKLIVVDTLSRAMAGGNENAPDDMGALVRSVDAIRAATGACVLLIHHSGKDVAKGARGHSLLRAAVDTEIEVRADEVTGGRTASVVKQRELTKGAAFGFRLDVQVLGQNQHGEDVTTCTVAAEAPAPAAPATGRINEEAATLLCEIHEAFATGQGRTDQPEPGMPDVPTISRGKLQAHLIRRGWLVVSSQDSNAVSKHESLESAMETLPKSEHVRLWKKLNHLKSKGLIGYNRDDAWLAKARGPL